MLGVMRRGGLRVRRLLLLPPRRGSGSGRGHLLRGVRLHVRVGVRGGLHHLRVVRLVHALALVRLLLPGARVVLVRGGGGDGVGGGRVRARDMERGRRELEREPRGVGRAPRELPPVVEVARGQRRGLVREVHVPDLVPGARVRAQARAHASALAEELRERLRGDPGEGRHHQRRDPAAGRGRHRTAPGRAVGRNGARGEARTPTRAGATCARERRGAQGSGRFEDRKARALEYSQSAR